MTQGEAHAKRLPLYCSVSLSLSGIQGEKQMPLFAGNSRCFKRFTLPVSRHYTCDVESENTGSTKPDFTLKKITKKQQTAKVHFSVS